MHGNSRKCQSNKWDFGFITFILFYTALVNHYHVTVGYHHAKLIVKYLPFVVGTILLFRARNKLSSVAIFVNRYKLLVSFYLSYLLVSLVSTIIGNQTLLGTSKLIYFFVTGFLLCIVSFIQTNTYQDALKFKNLFLFIGFVTALHGISLKHFSFDPFFLSYYSYLRPDQGYRVTGFMGNSIVYGTFLSMLVPFHLYEVISQHNNYSRRLVFVFGSLLLIYGILISGSRGVLIGLFFMISIFLWQNLKLLDKTRVLLRLSLVFLITVFLILFLHIYINGIDRLYPYVDQHISIMRLLNSNFQQEVSLISRLNKYPLTYSVIKEYPFWGVGFGNIGGVFESFQTEGWKTAEGQTKVTDNQFLMVLIETGLLGFSCYTGLLLSCVKECRPPKRELCADLQHSDLFKRACYLSIIGILPIMMTWDSLNHPSIRIYFWIMIGVALRLNSAKISK